MATEKPTYGDFLFDVHPQNISFVEGMNTYLQENGCKVEVKQAKSGYVVSYQHRPSKRVVANYIFRKQGMLVRIYGDHVGQYVDFLHSLPDALQAAMEKAPVCRRLLDPSQCNPRCPMGNTFELRGVTHKKCRYTSFIFPVVPVHHDAIRAFVTRELCARGQ